MLATRWIVEFGLAWLGRYRCLGKDCEAPRASRLPGPSQLERGSKRLHERLDEIDRDLAQVRQLPGELYTTLEQEAGEA